MTKILIISDVHANLVALQAVLASAGSIDQAWCLGDIAGYGARPNECIQLIRSLPNLTCMLGNHDLGVSGNGSLDIFNGDARKALLWQRDQINLENLKFLASLPGKAVEKEKVTLVHGSPRDPVWEYVLNTLTARLCLDTLKTPWCFLGHSHFQVVFQTSANGEEVTIEKPAVGEKYRLKEKALFNPGSVGQPRDRDPKAAYAIFDPEEQTWEPHRAEYDIRAAQQQIIAAGLPPRLAERLAAGW
jgi:diadenosine tetraphosphatase ApaH/serine/threonine PP2A family protein phosphatase